MGVPPFLLFFSQNGLEIQAVILQLVDEIAQDVHVVGGDNVSGDGDLLDLALVGVGHAGQEVQQTAGDLFICIRGLKTDGHLYIDDAVKQGAAAVLAGAAVMFPVK